MTMVFFGTSLSLFGDKVNPKPQRLNPIIQTLDPKPLNPKPKG